MPRPRFGWGPQERAERKADQERYDLETLERYHRLVHRFHFHSTGSAGHPDGFAMLRTILTEELPALLRKEGF